MSRPNEFSPATQQLALARQRFRCASCGTQIAGLGESGRAIHAFGESAQAHHMLPIRMGGRDAVDNCVILCGSCHYSAHEGGNYRGGSVAGRKTDFPHFSG